MPIIECEICDSWTVVSELPRNNICPVCLHQGSLFIQTKPNDIQKKALKECKNNA
jgi:hypothetical protein